MTPFGSIPDLDEAVGPPIDWVGPPIERPNVVVEAVAEVALELDAGSTVTLGQEGVE